MPAGVALDRRVQELLDLGKGHDLVELALDLPALHPQDGAVQIDVFPAGQLRVKAGAHLQERSHPAPNRHPPLGGLGDAGEDLEQGALAGPVAADDAQNLALGDFQGHSSRAQMVSGAAAAEGRGLGVPEPQAGAAQKPGEAFPQGAVGAVTAPEMVLLAQVVQR